MVLAKTECTSLNVYLDGRTKQRTHHKHSQRDNCHQSAQRIVANPPTMIYRTNQPKLSYTRRSYRMFTRIPVYFTVLL